MQTNKQVQIWPRQIARKSFLRFAALFLAAGSIAATSSFANSVTGNAATDGWTAGGNSLSSGTYVRGDANYDYDTYSTAMTAGAGLVTGTGASDWNLGDSVVGVGGIFTSATPSWTITGSAPNSLLTTGAALKLQAKFGTSTANFAASSIAPNAGNGLGSFGTNGGSGAAQVRTTGYNSANDWLTGAGILTAPTSSHFERNESPANDDVTVDGDLNAARLIWNTDSNGLVTSWEILLDTSLLGRIDGAYSAPAAGDLALMTVQNGDNGFTDALVSTPSAQAVPLPSAAYSGLALLGSLGLLGMKGRRQMV